MKTFIFIMLIFSHSLFANSKDSVDCQNETIASPLTIEIEALFDNVDSLLPLKSFKVSIENLSTGKSLSGITNEDGMIYLENYQPNSKHDYTLKVFSRWSNRLVCSAQLRSDWLVKRHRDLTERPVQSEAHRNISALYFVIDGRHLIDSIEVCNFKSLKEGIQYSDL